jgi:hypothetical protein
MMNSKSSEKKSAAKKVANSANLRQASASKRRLVDKQPQSKQQAAVANGMFLYTDDAWSLRYFDRNDLHCKEREVFG